jgi:hypothetical protein
MEIKPTYCTFEQARKLKEKGFDEKCLQGYNTLEKYLGELIVNFPNKNTDNIVISAPEQWQVVEWLRINHGLWVGIYYHNDNNKYQYIIDLLKLHSIKNWLFDGDTIDNGKQFNSPQEAYSAAFDYILKELI